ncbi:unnamed protein product [Brachionus calyciflorus]|uniref:Uncharacterized protein n=1 Tax=Brachionus calyciflorus TaxID=104777 RepID=A0A814QX23_9BILA|nr:unnamed protein product [Brachionus calyciflorus]
MNFRDFFASARKSFTSSTTSSTNIPPALSEFKDIHEDVTLFERLAITPLLSEPFDLKNQRLKKTNAPLDKFIAVKQPLAKPTLFRTTQPIAKHPTCKLPIFQIPVQKIKIEKNLQASSDKALIDQNQVDLSELYKKLVEEPLKEIPINQCAFQSYSSHDVESSM